MYEIALVLAIGFLIAVLFYKQVHEEFSISQIEYEQLPTLQELVPERQAIVIRNVPIPKMFTPEGLRQIPRLFNFPIGNHTLQQVLDQPELLPFAAPPMIPLANRERLAKEVGLEVWAEHTWQNPLKETSWSGFLGSMHTEAGIGGQGLTKSVAQLTCVFATHGSYLVSILPSKQEKFLPEAWKDRYPSSFTPNDSPLISEIQQLDIRLRQGTMLILPPHWMYSLQPEGSDLGLQVTIEQHEPISRLSKLLGSNEN